MVVTAARRFSASTSWSSYAFPHVSDASWLMVHFFPFFRRMWPPTLVHCSQNAQMGMQLSRHNFEFCPHVIKVPAGLTNVSAKYLKYTPNFSCTSGTYNCSSVKGVSWRPPFFPVSANLSVNGKLNRGDILAAARCCCMPCITIHLLSLSFSVCLQQRPKTTTDFLMELLGWIFVLGGRVECSSSSRAGARQKPKSYRALQ